MRFVSDLRLLAPAAVAAAFLSAPAVAGLAAWDQAQVTDIAQKLAAACDHFRQVLQDQPGGEVGSGDAQVATSLQNESEVLREQSRALAGHLAEGKGYDVTRDYYRGLKEVVDDMEDKAQRASLDEPTMDAWSKVADLMRQIAPYYDPKANG